MWLKSTRTKGSQGEQIARRYLRKKGFKVLEMNFHARFAEIDIIALDKKTLVFIEVKSAQSERFGNPLGWIPLWKQNKIIRASQLYLNKKGLHGKPLRFDVVAIHPDKRINHIQDAFRPRGDIFV